MKTILAWLVAWSLGFGALGQVSYDLPNVERYSSTNLSLAVIDFDGDGQIDADYQLGASGGGPDTFVSVNFRSDEVTTYLASAKKVATFSLGEAISSSTKRFTNSFGFFGYSLDNYRWEKFFEKGIPHYAYSRLSGSEFPTLTDVLVGLRFAGGDGKPHHAWIRLTRPDNNLGTLFQVASYAYNPLPDEPIQAGLPAPPPPVSSSVDAVNGGFVFSWPEKAAPYFKLQTRADLGPATEWAEVDTGDGHSYTAPPDSAQGYYRLIQR